jgi:hypothetical protein
VLHLEGAEPAMALEEDELDRLARRGLLLNLRDLQSIWLNSSLRERYLCSWEQGCAALRDELARAIGIEALLPRLDLEHRIVVLTALRDVAELSDLSRIYSSLMTSGTNLSSILLSTADATQSEQKEIDG